MEIKKDTKKIVTRSYVFALFLIAITTTTAHYITRRIVHQQENSAIEINIAGRQRMLTQRIALFANKLATKISTEQRTTIQAELLSARNLFANSHQSLINGDKQIGIRVATAPDILVVYQSAPAFLNRQIEIFLEKIDTILQLPPQHPDLIRLAEDIFDTASARLLSDLNLAVSRRETEARVGISQAENFELMALLVTLGTLCLEVLLIFSPMVRMIERREESLREARHDPLTGLANRRQLAEELALRAQICAETGSRLGLLHIDLDRFKHINDTIGHPAGDYVLQQTSVILKTHACKESLVARIGGDEFVVVMPFEGSSDKLEALADKIIKTARKPMYFDDQVCHIGVSIGIAVETGRFVDPDRMMIDSDLALYLAKRRGKNRYEFFNTALRTEANETRRLVNEITIGLERSEFEPHFQGQYDTKSQQLLGVEALVRWNHPTRGVLAPDAFIKVAEQMGLIAAIDRQILEKACLQVKDWNQKSIKVPRLSVNVSASRLASADLVDQVIPLLSKKSVLAFEVRETIFVDQLSDTIKWNIEQLRALNVELDIDDFGTGNASIVGLMELKPDRLKIDRQIITPSITAPNNRAAIRAIVDIAKIVNAKVIAQGVETEKHMNIVNDLGCHALQGFALGHPLPAAQFYQQFLSDKIAV